MSVEMDSLANYDSEDELDAPISDNVISDEPTSQCGMEGDNYDDVQMDMSENPLNGSKAPSVQAHSLGRSGGAPPTSATTQLDSNSESVSKEDSKCSPHNSNRGSRSSSSPASAQSSSDDESDRDSEKLKSGDPLPKLSKVSEDKQATEKIENVSDNSDKVKNQDKRDYDNRRDRDRERDKYRERERERERNKERDNRDKRKDFRRDERHRSRSRDRRDRRRSPERCEKRRSRERNEPQRPRERRSTSREHGRRESDQKYSDSKGRDHERKRHRSRSRSLDRHRPGNDSRSSSSSGGSRSDTRLRDGKGLTTSGIGPSKRSRSPSRSPTKERTKLAGGDTRKFYMEKKIDRKLNVLERMGIELKAEAKSTAGLVTPQMLVQRTMEQEAEQVKKATGVELPSYYNAAAVNPQRLVDQIQKRKLLWGARKDDATKAIPQPQASNKWQGATFAQDQDGKLTAKFNRLMGIKQPPQAPSNASGEVPSGSEIIKKQEEMFHNMESQYEVARLATHTHRGLGLGFGTFQPR